MSNLAEDSESYLQNISFNYLGCLETCVIFCFHTKVAQVVYYLKTIKQMSDLKKRCEKDN